MPDESTLSRATRWTREAALWLRDTGLGGFGFALVLVVALSGWSASFIGLHAFGTEHMTLSQHAAWLVPMTFDGAPAGLSIVVMRAGIHGRNATLWRILIVAFTLLSSWINWEHIADPTGRDVAALMPPSAVILFEGLMSEVRAAARRREGARIRPSLHPLRWVFDRSGTWEIVRCYVLSQPLPDAMASAMEAATVAPQASPQGATVDLVKRHRDTPQSAPADATEAPSVTPQDAIMAATDDATERPGDTLQSATADATTVTIEAPPRTPRIRSVKRHKGSDRSLARDTIRALYDALGARPLESEMTEALIKAKCRYTSRQFANKIRKEIERDAPELAALGSDNVRPLAG